MTYTDTLARLGQEHDIAALKCALKEAHAENARLRQQCRFSEGDTVKDLEGMTGIVTDLLCRVEWPDGTMSDMFPKELELDIPEPK